jgi:hypothetical protein
MATIQDLKQALADAGITPEIQSSFRKLQPTAPAMSGGKPRYEPTFTQPRDVGKPASADSTTSVPAAAASAAVAPAPAAVASKAPSADILSKIPADKLAQLQKASKEDLQTAAAQMGIKIGASTPNLARPYRFKINDKIKSYQIVDNKWKQVEYDTRNQLKVVKDVPPYLVGTLTALKKKVDAQRAAGNLTDSQKPKSGRIL